MKKHYYTYSDKSNINYWIAPVKQFISNSTSSGIILMCAAILALVWANSPFRESYHHLWETHLSFSIGSFEIDKDLHHWINDGLMSIFFFVVGLELKREIIGGELSDIKSSMLPLIAAIGGMVMPALIYLAFNSEGATMSGWGIPMATDIAFALGILYFLGDRVPISLKIFLTALAIADDIGAVLVIAFFYTSNISFDNLLIGSLFMAVLLGANFLKVRSSIFYGIIGIGGLWTAFLLSGIHATVAGVLAAFTIPAFTEIDEQRFIFRMEELLNAFRKAKPNNNNLITTEQLNIIESMKKKASSSETPLQRLEYGMHPVVAFVIMPIFALANAGVELSAESFGMLLNPISLGIILGLLLGKFFGIVGLCKVAVKFKIASLPKNTKWTHIYGVAFLAAVGFTMSLFISELAFTDREIIDQAKLAVLVASVIGGLTGYLILNFSLPRDKNSL